MPYIQINLKSKNKVSHEERLSYINSLFGSHYEQKKGMITKFNNAYHFKDVVDDSFSKFPTIIPAKVETPESYISPESLLFKTLWVDLSKNGIVKFLIRVGTEEHPISKYSYDREEISKQFVQFLSKVYPDITIEMTTVNSFRYTVQTFVLNHLYLNLDRESDKYTVECASHRLLTDKEKENIYKKLAGFTNYEWSIEQFFCKTCESYDKKTPYHIEVAYK